jgi:hypothetical protein
MLGSLYSSDLVTNAIFKNSDPLALEPKLVLIIVIKHGPGLTRLRVGSRVSWVNSGQPEKIKKKLKFKYFI